MNHLSRKYWLGIVFMYWSVFSYAGGKEKGGSDTLHDYSSVSLIQALQKNSASFTNEELVSYIDLLMDADTVSPQYYLKVMEQLKKNEITNTYHEKSEYPATQFYSTWDTKNFFNINDLLKCDTVMDITLLDSLHSTYVHPCPGMVTSVYGWRGNAMHKGIDIDLNKGDKVYSAFDGVVRMALRHAGYGNVVVVRHYNGLETTYAHLSKIKVKLGQEIKAGDVVGLGGSTGNATGSHLHFELRFKGLPINPSNIISFKNHELNCGNEITIRKNKWGLYAYPKDAEFHIIEKGDTLYGISKKYGIDMAHLRELNGLTKKTYLKVGQQIRIL